MPVSPLWDAYRRKLKVSLRQLYILDTSSISYYEAKIKQIYGTYVDIRFRMPDI